MLCPIDCPIDVYMLMKSCWATNAEERPSFGELYNSLKEVKNKIVDKAVNNNVNDYNNVNWVNKNEYYS